MRLASLYAYELVIRAADCDGPQVVRVQPEGPLLVVFNDHKRETMKVGGKEVKIPDKCRTQLTLAVSEDEGQTWRCVRESAFGIMISPYVRFCSLHVRNLSVSAAEGV